MGILIFAWYILFLKKKKKKKKMDIIFSILYLSHNLLQTVLKPTVWKGREYTVTNCFKLDIIFIVK